MSFLEAVPFDKILNGSGWAVAFWSVLYVTRMVLRGDLVPRKTHDAATEALTIERERNALLLAKLGDMTDSMETFEVFVRALPTPPTLPALPSVRGQQRRQRNGAS